MQDSQLQSNYGTSNVTTNLNHNLPLYFSPVQDSMALGVDACYKNGTTFKFMPSLRPVWFRKC